MLVKIINVSMMGERLVVEKTVILKGRLRVRIIGFQYSSLKGTDNCYSKPRVEPISYYILE